MDYNTTTRNKRTIIEQESDSPVTRIRIKKNELIYRYSQNCSDDRRDEIYDIIRAIESNVEKYSPTVRIKILDTDTLDTIQCEIGNTENQTKIIKTRGVDYL
jgi:hypothetical protein